MSKPMSTFYKVVNSVNRWYAVENFNTGLCGTLSNAVYKIIKLFVWRFH